MCVLAICVLCLEVSIQSSARFPLGCLAFWGGIDLNELFVYFGDESLVGHFVCKYFLPSCRLPFCFVYGFLCCANPFVYNQVPFVCFWFILITLKGGSRNILPRFMSKSVLPMFSSKSFKVSDLTFRYLIHFQFIFVYGVTECSKFHSLTCSCPVSQHHLWKRLSFLPCIVLPLLLQIN